MGKVNVRRGAFRLWLVASVVWVLGFGLLTEGPIQAAFKARANYDAMAKVTKNDTVLVPQLCGTARGQLHKDYEILVPNGTAAPIGPPSPSDTCWYAMPDYRRLYPEQRQLGEEELLQQTYSDTGQPPPTPRPNPWETATNALVVAVGVPLAVLVAGAALLWALAGFKKGPEPERT